MQIKPLNRQMPGLAHRGRCTAVVSAITGLLLPAGLAPEVAEDGKAFTSLLYANGPGFAISNGSRPNVNDSQSGECIGSCGPTGGTTVWNSWEGGGPPKGPKSSL